MDHYKRDCLDAQGVNCVANPYCKVRGMRRGILEHEKTCPYVKIECERCESKVIRKMIATSHNCFENAATRLEKVERTLAYGYKRLRHQTEARLRFDSVITNVKKKMASLNKRLEHFIFLKDSMNSDKLKQIIPVKRIEYDPCIKCKVCWSTESPYF